MKLLYGTTNPSKLTYMREQLKPLDIELFGLNDLNIKLPMIDESGNNPLENARIKAHAYYELTKQPVFSCDSGLFIDGLEESLQPGVHVRNVNGQSLSDDEMLEYYAGIAKKCGGSCIARYKNAICFVKDATSVYESDEDDLSGESFIITSIPHKLRSPGFPIDSLSVHIKTGQYYYDMDTTRSASFEYGFQRFFLGCSLGY